MEIEKLDDGTYVVTCHDDAVNGLVVAADEEHLINAE